MPDRTLTALFAQRFGEAPTVPAEVAENAVLTQIAARASCRAFKHQAVEIALLETLCAAALSAPSKSDLQQRDIVIITDAELLTQLKTLLAAQAWITDVPAMVVFLANNRRQRHIQHWHAQPFPNDHLDAFFNASVDAGIALATFMTAAEATGLGCCPISTIRNHLDDVKDLLQLPDHVFPVAAMAVGHPAGAPDISPRLPLSKTIHYNHFADITEEEVKGYDTRRLDGADGPGWSEAKARMYAAPQRTDFGSFVRQIGFNLD
ncbi:nitroreductase family protein [Roseobacter sp. A03A-229]